MYTEYTSLLELCQAWEVMRLDIYELVFDDWNEQEMARHGVVPREVQQVLDETPRFFRNKRGHVAELLMVGPTYGGRLLTSRWSLAPSHCLGE